LKHRVHEYASGLTSTPKAELFCSCKRRKFRGQNKVKIDKLLSQNFKFLGQKIGCLSCYLISVLESRQNLCVCIFTPLFELMAHPTTLRIPQHVLLAHQAPRVWQQLV